MKRAIKTDHWVKTADGSIGRVRYVHERDETADIAIDGDWDHQVTLSLAEMRRIVGFQKNGTLVFQNHSPLSCAIASVRV